MPGSSVNGQKKNRSCPLPGTSHSTPKASLSNATSPEPNNASSLKSRMASSQNSSQSRMVSSHSGLQRITSSGLPSTRTLPSPDFYLKSNPTFANSVPLVRPFPGKKSSSNIQPPLNLPRTLDKRRNTEVPFRIKRRSLDEFQKSAFTSRPQEPSVSVTWDLAPLPSSITKISAAAHPNLCGRRLYKCIICCKSFKYEASLQLHRQREHSIARKLKCLKCDQPFEDMQLLKEHTVVAHKKAEEESRYGSEFRLDGCFKVCKSLCVFVTILKCEGRRGQ